MLLPGIVGVQIREMRVPAVVESGKQAHVILDCDYDLSENEGRQVSLISIWFNIKFFTFSSELYPGGCQMVL